MVDTYSIKTNTERVNKSWPKDDIDSFFLSMRRFCSWIWFSLGATNTHNKMPILFIKMRANRFRREAFDVRIEMHLKLLHFLLPDLSCVFFFWKYIPYRKYWANFCMAVVQMNERVFGFFGDCFLFPLVHKVVGIICLVAVDAMKEWMRLVWLVFSDWSNVWLLLVNLINPVKTLYIQWWQSERTIGVYRLP